MLRAHRARVLAKVGSNPIRIVIMKHERACLRTEFIVAGQLLHIVEVNIIVHVIILILLYWLVKL